MNRISELRKECGLTQKELSDKININYSVISRIETGERAIKDDELLMFSKFFNCSADYIIGNSPNRNKRNSNYVNDELLDFPEGVDVLRRSTQELSPRAREVMIKHMNQFIDDLKEMDSKKDED